MNTKIFKIALNNVIKHKRRTIFNTLTFAANAIALIWLIGMINGMYNQAYEQTISLDTGHFKIYHNDYAEHKIKMPIEYNIRNPYKLIDEIKTIPHFVSAAPRIMNSGMLSNTENKTTVAITGIDMGLELKTTTLFSKMKEDNYLENGAGQVLIGKRLAEMMKIQPGDFMLLYAQTQYKANNLVDAVVKGIYSTGFAPMEKRFVYVPLDFAQSVFDMENRATEIIIRIDERKYVDEVKPELERIVSKYPGLVVRDWKQEAAALIAGAQADYFSYGVIFAILLFLAVFIIMNTLTIAVFERTAEIGTIRAIGLEKNQVRWIFLWEGVILSLGGAIIGGILALPLVYYMNVVGITFPAEFADKIPFPIESMLSKNAPFDWVLTTVICLVTGVIGAIFPANRAAGTNVVDALKKGVR